MAELIIIFREVLEASLIIGILFTYLKKSNNEDSLKMLWGGVFVYFEYNCINSIPNSGGDLLEAHLKFLKE